jgi:uncharacterized protein YgiM (DUF1202 family)
MIIQEGCIVRVIASHQAPYPDPIRVSTGEVVRINDDKKTDIAGWIWCTSNDGKSGWVPETYLNRQGKSTSLRCDYDAIELTVQGGEILTVKKIESGFCWVTDQTGRAGWLPIDHLTPQPGKLKGEAA